MDHNVSVWSSADLAAWSLVTREAVSIADRPLGIYFRPKILYNKKSQLYVLWVNYMHYPAPYHLGFYLTATSKTPEGPFTIQNKNVSMTQKPAIYCDFDLMVDDDGKGYIIYTVWNAQGQPKQPTHMSVELLSDDYLSSALKASPVWTGAAGRADEAPVIFKRKGVYYALFGHGCCFCSTGSGMNVFTAIESPLGPWSAIPYDVGCAEQNTFNTLVGVSHDSSSTQHGFLFGKSKASASVHSAAEVAGIASTAITSASSSAAAVVASPPNIGNCASFAHAQQNCIIDVNTTEGMRQIWTGDRWQSAPDHMKSHDFQYWGMLEWDDSVVPAKLKHLEWQDSFTVDLA